MSRSTPHGLTLARRILYLAARDTKQALIAAGEALEADGFDAGPSNPGDTYRLLQEAVKTGDCKEVVRAAQAIAERLHFLDGYKNLEEAASAYMRYVGPVQPSTCAELREARKARRLAWFRGAPEAHTRAMPGVVAAYRRTWVLDEGLRKIGLHLYCPKPMLRLGMQTCSCDDVPLMRYTGRPLSDVVYYDESVQKESA